MIMILTGKCKEDFEKWYSSTESEIKHSLLTSLFQSKSNIEKYSYYISFFDSVGIIINVGGVLQNGIYSFSFDIQENNTLNGIDEYGFSTRQEVTKQAIIKANNIYNKNQ